MPKSKVLRKYLSLREEVDRECARLYALHAPHLQCREGCDQCCMDFGIFPAEYYAILEQAGNHIQNGRKPVSEGACPFLINHRCVIYAARPIICRTQGLPLLFMGDEGWELSACELNFTQFDFGNFHEENTFPLDRYNSRLYLINKEFIKTFPGKPYQAFDLLPLSRLLNQG